jgi:N-acetylmuramoyl-L-alanine amidase CwlA
MSYTFIDQAMPANKKSLKQPYAMTPRFITIHNTSNSAPAKNEVSYMQGNNAQTGFHVAIDETYVIKCADFNRNTWHAGDGTYGTGNRQSIGIEICRSTGSLELFRKAEQNCAEYVAKLLKEYGWDISRVKRHKDWSGKYCPHKTMDLGWDRFINMIKVELNKLYGKTHAGGSNANVNPTPSAPTTATETKKESAFKVGNYNNYVVTTDSLNVRSARNANSTLLTSIPKGTKVYVGYVMYQDNSATARGSLWGGVTYNGKTGFINLSYVEPYAKEEKPTQTTTIVNYVVKINTDVLNVRKEPNANSAITTSVRRGQAFTIIEEKNGWGKLKSGAGWINLSYTKKI